MVGNSTTCSCFAKFSFITEWLNLAINLQIKEWMFAIILENSQAIGNIA